MKYDFKKIERKWQKKWDEEKLYQVDVKNSAKPFYNLMMFPYPSAEGLHVGNMYAFTGSDIYGRYQRLKGNDVFEPIGLDGFGIHSENFAIKNKIHPAEMAEKTQKNFYKQLHMIGNSYDWSKTLETYDPEYYKWTQWLFLQMYKKGLAYKKKAGVNWCPSCMTVLSDEQVEAGLCERCKTEVVKKDMSQWFFKITDYAEKLLKNIDKIDWTEKTKLAQKNWIGKSEGALIEFEIKNFSNSISNTSNKISNTLIEVFTTRPDTLFGCTYLVLSPEHKFIEESKEKIENWNEVEEYIKKAKEKTDQERTNEKTGVELKGIKAVNRANEKQIPIFVADYVLSGYGTGAIMAVPAHDERDFEFAQKYNLEIIQVVAKLFYDIEGKDKVRTEKKTERRETVYVFLKHWNEDKYLCLDWKDLGWHSGIAGGMEDKEDIIKAAKREILEETGYKNVKFIKHIGGEIHNYFFAPHKDLNRYAIGHQLLFQLENDEHVEIDLEEIKNHSMLWVEGKEMNKFLNVPNWIDMWKTLQGDVSTCYSGDGVLINSGKFDGIKSNEAKQVITKFVQGKLKTNYKLRDWCISRQRFWGPPIPIVYCENCKKNIEEKSFELRFRDINSFADLKSGQKTVESRALNPEEKDRYFGNLKIGDYVKALSKITGEKLYFEITKIYNFKNLNELFEEKELLAKILPNKTINSVNDLEKLYAFNDEYLAKINENGLIAWEIENVEPGVLAVSEKDLPVMLPKTDDYMPDGTDRSPLARNDEFVKTKCPKCGGDAKRETDVSDTFLDSSWYFLRYPSVDIKDQPFDKEITKKWLPVDMYIGGHEHAVLHLLYTRFVTMVLHDLGMIDFEEPFKKFRAHGLIIKDGAKMSKSKGNVVNPDIYIERYGADVLRTYLMFIGPLKQGGDFRDEGVVGIERFFGRLFFLVSQVLNSLGNEKHFEIERNKLIKKATNDIENLDYNTIIASLMEFLNLLDKQKEKVSKNDLETLIIILSPLAPHFCEEMWEMLGNKTSVFKATWPMFDESKMKEEKVKLIIQVNGKVRDFVEVEINISEEKASELVQNREKVMKYIAGKKIKKIIFVKGRLINIVA